MKQASRNRALANIGGESVCVTLPAELMDKLGVDRADPEGWVRITDVDLDSDASTLDLELTIRAPAHLEGSDDDIVLL